MSLKGKRIFIVEDDLENRIIAQMLLEEQGAVLFFDRWGQHTCERLRVAVPIDLILLDLMFPNNVTGFDIFEKIRAIPDFARVPVVAFSASDTSTAVPKARAKGFAGFLTKPVKFNAFTKQVEAILAGEQIWQTH